ncbi:Chemotaxis protein OS=Stutzerimonas stutzeri OX=316 GN=CXK95_06600 PE=4 SV=1 [Stutzerimonas stutzeri]
MNRTHTLLMLSLTAALGVMPLAHAATPAAPATAVGSMERAQAKQAKALLDNAALYLQANGPEQALAAFNNRDGAFAKGQYYIFVLGTDGTMRASAGTSASLVGLNVRDLKDASGKPFINDILEAAKRDDSGAVAYHWLNPADNKVENKLSQFRKVGENILCVGYYIPRATAEQAQALLDKAVARLREVGGETAYRQFNERNGEFFVNDEYVFVIGLEDGKYRASGGSPNLVGVDVRAVNDAAGKPLFREMIELARKDGTGTVEYVWRNPVTNAVEHKRTLIQRVDDVLLGVGYYTPR